MSEYTEVAVLRGHQEGILSLGISVCGRFIAATGYAGIYLWDVAQQQALRIPPPPSTMSEKHFYTRCAWLHFEETELPVLILGSMRGDVFIWKWSAIKGGFQYTTHARCSADSTQVLSMDVSRRSVPAEQWGCVAMCTDDGRVTVWEIKCTADHLRRKFVLGPEPALEPAHRPRTVKFDLRSQTISTFSVFGGIMIRYHIDTGDRAGVRVDGPDLMASVAVDNHRSIFAAHTGTSIELHSLQRQKHLRTIAVEEPDVHYPMYMCFSEDGNILISGTDKGRATIYDSINGDVIQTLPYPMGGLVQQVEACTTADFHLIAIAGSSIRRSADVIVYRKARVEPLRVRTTAPVTTSSLPDNACERPTSRSFGYALLVVVIWTAKLGLFIYVLAKVYTVSLNYTF
ncbi:WD40-repeat-containing domain protein [Schizophyllum commune]